MPSWIDFKELRSKLKFEDVLRLYGVELRMKGEFQHVGPCPLPNHPAGEKNPTFSANLEKGIFQCFKCHAKGNVLDFAVLMSKERPDDGRAVKRVAAELRAKLLPAEAKQNGREAKQPVPKPESAQLEMGIVVNPPLDFELKGLNAAHESLAQSGLTSQTIAMFGLGYCSRGYFAGRIAFPLHDADGRLVGYAGRVIDERQVSRENPEYLFPASRERDGVSIEFVADRFVYNGNRLAGPVDNLVVVEEFESVWWLAQLGFPNVVSTMGSGCSGAQASQIVKLTSPNGRVSALPCGNGEGRRFAHSVFESVGAHRPVRWFRLEADVHPYELSGEKLRSCLA